MAQSVRVKPDALLKWLWYFMKPWRCQIQSVTNHASYQDTPVNPLPAKLWNEKGEFQRPATQFRTFISKEPGARFPPSRDR